MHTQRHNWQKAKKTSPGHWAHNYVSINSKGVIVMSRHVHEKLGSPAAVFILVDVVTGTLGIEKASVTDEDAYKACINSTSSGARHINALKTVQDFGLQIPETVRFTDAHIDDAGVLVLDLRAARVLKRVITHQKNEGRKEEDPM